MKEPLKASWMLLLATVFWGLSFVAMPALAQAQHALLPQVNTWVFSSLSVIVRFGISSIVLLILCLKTWRQISRSEIVEGLGLGVIGGVGLLLQMDGVNYTTPSTSAFLTQSYCLFIPIIVAFREKRRPSPVIFVSSLMVLGGVMILANFDFHKMQLGRGELETLLATLFFTGQILWLERKDFGGNKPHHFSLVMFITTALVMLPVPVFFHLTPSEAVHAFSTFPTLFFAGILTLFCTLGAYTLMNYWQSHIEATKAGLIYCAEPVFASLFALFLPGLFSKLAHINNPNEKWTSDLALGGGLITAANIVIILHTAHTQQKSTASTGLHQKIEP